MPRFALLLGLGLLVLTAGCQSSRSARAQPRASGRIDSFSEAPGRGAYIDTRVRELTKTGMSREDAAARAAREWFAQSSSTIETPSYAERKRRAAQANFEKTLAEQLESDRR